MSDSSDPMNCILPGSSVHGIFHAGVLEWVAISFSTFSFLHRIFSTHRLNLGLLYYRQMLYHLSHQGNWILCNINGRDENKAALLLFTE